MHVVVVGPRNHTVVELQVCGVCAGSLSPVPPPVLTPLQAT